MTPDTVETRLGTLNFVDGVPTAATTQLVYDNLDFMRGTEVFLNLRPGLLDMGAPGPDRGAGGKYLIVPDWFEGELPKDKTAGGDYFIARSPSQINVLILRGFLVDGKPDASSQMFRTGLKIYPLAAAAHPPQMEFGNVSRVPFNTIHANDFEFYAELDHVVQREPLDLFDPELRGLAAAIGIEKGRNSRPMPAS